MSTSLEEQSAALLYRIACDLEAEITVFDKNSIAVSALKQWRRMDADLAEYRAMQLLVSKYAIKKSNKIELTTKGFSPP